MYDFHTCNHASMMIDLYNLSQCSINDFEAFEQYLFTEEERQLPDLDRFHKFVVIYKEFFWSIAIPFEKPDTIVEYQINHYVMWATIAYLKENEKPDEFFSYNTGDNFDAPMNTCYACHYTAKLSIPDYPNCNHCPIWERKEEDFRCERDTETLYHFFNHIYTEDREELKECAFDLARSPWSVR